MTHRIRILAPVLLGGWLAACGASPGPDSDVLLGAWSLSTDVEVDATTDIEDTRIVYRPDGTSDYSAVLRVADPGAPGGSRAFDLDADVRWTLEETVLTRTLDAIEVTPRADTPQDREIAALYRADLSSSPPSRFIIESAGETELRLLDPDTGETLVFARTG